MESIAPAHGENLSSYSFPPESGLNAHTAYPQPQPRTHFDSVYVPSAYKQNVRSSYTSSAPTSIKAAGSVIQSLDQATSSNSAVPLLFQAPPWFLDATQHAPQTLPTSKLPQRRESSGPSLNEKAHHDYGTFPHPISFLPRADPRPSSQFQIQTQNQNQAYSHGSSASDIHGGIVPLSSVIPAGPLKWTMPAALDPSGMMPNGIAGVQVGGGYVGGFTGMMNMTSGMKAGGSWNVARGLEQAWVGERGGRKGSGSMASQRGVGVTGRGTFRRHSTRGPRQPSVHHEESIQTTSRPEDEHRYTHTAPIPTLQQPEKRYQPYPIRNAYVDRSTMTEPIPRQPALGSRAQVETNVLTEPIAAPVSIPAPAAPAQALHEINFDMDTDLNLDFDLGDLTGIDDLFSRTIVPMNAAMHGNPNPLPEPIGAEIKDNRKNTGARLAKTLTRPRSPCGPIIIGTLSPKSKYREHRTEDKSEEMTVEVQSPGSMTSEPASQTPVQATEPKFLKTKYNTLPTPRKNIAMRPQIGSFQGTSQGWTDMWAKSGRSLFGDPPNVALHEMDDNAGAISTAVRKESQKDQQVPEPTTFSRHQSSSTCSVWTPGVGEMPATSDTHDLASPADLPQSPTDLTSRMKNASIGMTMVPPLQSEIMLRAMLHHLEGWNGEPPMKPEETRAIKVMWRENLDKRKWHLMYRTARVMIGSGQTAFVPPSKQCTCCVTGLNRQNDPDWAPLLPVPSHCQGPTYKSKWPCLVLMEEIAAAEGETPKTMSRGTCLACVMRKSKCSFVDKPVEGLPISSESAPPSTEAPEQPKAASPPERTAVEEPEKIKKPKGPAKRTRGRPSVPSVKDGLRNRRSTRRSPPRSLRSSRRESQQSSTDSICPPRPVTH